MKLIHTLGEFGGSLRDDTQRLKHTLDSIWDEKFRRIANIFTRNKSRLTISELFSYSYKICSIRRKCAHKKSDRFTSLKSFIFKKFFFSPPREPYAKRFSFSERKNLFENFPPVFSNSEKLKTSRTLLEIRTRGDIEHDFFIAST